MVANAVVIEPGSAGEFSANREICRFRSISSILTLNPDIKPIGYGRIPYFIEQGIFCGRVGNFGAITGNLRARIEIIAG